MAQSVKEVIVDSDESATVYGSNFDGIPARVLRTSNSESLMAKRPLLPTIIFRAFQAARNMNIPLWKIIPGLMTQFDKIFMVAQFGAATKSLMAATVDGELDTGVQFVGQSQGMIDAIEPVDLIVQRIVQDARLVLSDRADLFDVRLV
jgi:enoyl-[acyl-carrier protein] reductase II